MVTEVQNQIVPVVHWRHGRGAEDRESTGDDLQDGE